MLTICQETNLSENYANETEAVFHGITKLNQRIMWCEAWQSKRVMLLQAWEERAGAVFCDAKSHEDGHTAPSLHTDYGWPRCSHRELQSWAGWVLQPGAFRTIWTYFTLYINSAYGLSMPWCWQWGAAGLASVRRDQKLPPCWTETAPAGFQWTHRRTQLSLSARLVAPPGKSIWERVKNTAQQLWEKGVRKCKRNSPVDTKIREKGEKGDAPDAGEEIPLQPMEKTKVMQVVPLQPLEDHGEADIHAAAHGNLKWMCPKRICCSWRDHAEAGFL